MNAVLFSLTLPSPKNGRGEQKGETMDSQNDRSQEQAQPQIVNLQEQFGAQLQDQSLSAAQVLIQQEEAHTANEYAALYIP
jgi:hypothetical protein